MKKIKELINKNRKMTCIIALILCLIVIVIAVFFAIFGNGRGDRKRAKQLEQAAEKQIYQIKKDIEKMDRDTFITVDNKVVVGFLSLPNQDVKYPVINVFDNNTNTYSLCRYGNNMPWDIEGMTIYGIDSFTKIFEDIKPGEKLEFEDLAGKKYEYIYEKGKKEKAVDYGITICNVSKNGNVNKKYCFVKK